MKRYCLLIEDEPKYVSYKNIERNVKSKTGIDLEIISFDPQENRFQKEEDDKIFIDKDKLSTELEMLLKRSIDVIACDFDLSDDKINGIEVIRIIKNIKPKKRFFLFSGLIDKVVDSIIGDYSKTSDKQRLFKNIKTLINTGISDFVDREDLQIENAIISNLKNFTWEEELNRTFDSNQHLPFKSGFPPFKNKTLNEIKKEIDDDTIKSQEFKNAILNLVISQIIEADE